MSALLPVKIAHVALLIKLSFSGDFDGSMDGSFSSPVHGEACYNYEHTAKLKFEKEVDKQKGHLTSDVKVKKGIDSILNPCDEGIDFDSLIQAEKSDCTVDVDVRINFCSQRLFKFYYLKLDLFHYLLFII